MPQITLTVKGMHCKSCKMLIEDALEDIGVENAQISVDEQAEVGTITIDTDIEKEKVISAIEAEGDYKVE